MFERNGDNREKQGNKRKEFCEKGGMSLQEVERRRTKGQSIEKE